MVEPGFERLVGWNGGDTVHGPAGDVTMLLGRSPGFSNAAIIQVQANGWKIPVRAWDTTKRYGDKPGNVAKAREQLRTRADGAVKEVNFRPGRD